MSGGYYNSQQQQQQGYAMGNYHQESSEAPQYMQQNYGFGNHNPGFVPAYPNNNSSAFASPMSEEYLRQAATSPYHPSAPMPMPEPAIVRMTEPAPAPAPDQQPRVIIIQHPPSQDDDCCSVICGCIDWLLTRICYVILTFIVIVVLIAVGIWLLNKYRRN